MQSAALDSLTAPRMSPGRTVEGVTGTIQSGLLGFAFTSGPQGQTTTFSLSASFTTGSTHDNEESSRRTLL